MGKGKLWVSNTQSYFKYWIYFNGLITTFNILILYLYKSFIIRNFKHKFYLKYHGNLLKQEKNTCNFSRGSFISFNFFDKKEKKYENYKFITFSEPTVLSLLKSGKRIELPLVKKDKISHDTFILKFAFEDKE